VGGRIQSSSLSVDRNHPILLPAKHHVTQKIIRKAHIKTLHGRTQLTLNHLRSKFWIINGKTRVQSTLIKCIPCFKTKIKISHQIMGSLPVLRVSTLPPFAYTQGWILQVFNIRMSEGKKAKSYKGFVA
jgi:hypothetical protein